MKNAILAFLIAGMLLGVSFAAEKVQLKDENDRISYSYGFQIGEGLKRQGDTDINPDVLVKGLQDALSESEPQMSQEEMRAILQQLKDKNRAAKYEERRQKAEQYRGEGREFLAENAKKPGVVTLPSGLQYRVIKQGTGKTPGPHDSVTVNYRGTLLNGNEFDSSYREGKPARFRVDGVIKGWTEALQLMKEGANWQLFIPPDLAYGERGPLRDRTVIFEVELLETKPSKE